MTAAMFDNVLVALDPDHGDITTKVLQAAKDIADANGATLHLVNVIPAAPVIVSQYLSEGRRRRGRLRGALRSHLPGDSRPGPGSLRRSHRAGLPQAGGFRFPHRQQCGARGAARYLLGIRDPIGAIGRARERVRPVVRRRRALNELDDILRTPPQVRAISSSAAPSIPTPVAGL